MSNKISTVAEYFDKRYKELGINCVDEIGNEDVTIAKELIWIHVKAALKAASEKAKIIDDPTSYTGNTGSEYLPDQIVSRKSILNAYPKENIL